MRYLIVKRTGLEQGFSIKKDIKPIYSHRINLHNIVVIDETYPYDITYSFPFYIFEVNKIINSFSKSSFDRICKLNHTWIYNKPVDKSLIKDITILLRSYDYKKVHIPNISRDGKIRLVLIDANEKFCDNMCIHDKIEHYTKLRTIIFNTCILPYIKFLFSI